MTVFSNPPPILGYTENQLMGGQKSRGRKREKRKNGGCQVTYLWAIIIGGGVPRWVQKVLGASSCLPAPANTLSSFYTLLPAPSYHFYIILFPLYINSGVDRIASSNPFPLSDPKDVHHFLTKRVTTTYCRKCPGSVQTMHETNISRRVSFFKAPNRCRPFIRTPLFVFLA